MNDPSLALPLTFRAAEVKAVMSHLAARILAILQENRPYELRSNQDRPISKMEATGLIRQFRVLEETRQARRRRKANEGRLTGRRTREAARAPQSGLITPPLRKVYRAEELQSIAD